MLQTPSDFTSDWQRPVPTGYETVGSRAGLKRKLCICWESNRGPSSHTHFTDRDNPADSNNYDHEYDSGKL
jgi:hypothetical protein